MTGQTGKGAGNLHTWQSLLKWGETLLESAKIPEARLDAWLLLEYTAGISRAWYFAHYEETASEDTVCRYQELLEKRASRIPLQHLTHQAFFMGNEFYVDERVLIPRQDTECLVEAALSCLETAAGEKSGSGGMESTDQRNGHPYKILDLCTGSGCILLSLLSEVPSAAGTGTDISEEALQVANINAGRLSLESRAEFVRSDLFFGEILERKEKYHLIVSNPPYIPTAQIGELMDEVRLYDPCIALDGGADGLSFYRRISRIAPELLLPGGYLLLEIGYDQGAAVKRLLEEAGFAQILVLQDLAGLDRVAAGRLRYEKGTCMFAEGSSCLNV